MEENQMLINNQNKFEQIIKNMEESIQSLILFRSLYLIKKKFDKYKSNINKIYQDFNINKSKRIDALGSFQIDINLLDKILLLVLKEINLFILELSSPKDIFLSYFLISNKKLEEMELIINNMKKEIIEKNLVEKYNKIFYDKKIKPLFEKKNTENNLNEEDNEEAKEEEIYNIIITEYNRKGKIIKNYEEIQIENENNKKEMKEKNTDIYIILNNDGREQKNKLINNNAIFVETIPLILADYFQENKKYAIVEIEEEFSKELDLLFNKDLLIKINEYDEFIQKYKNYNNNTNVISKELKQYSLQLKQVQKNIKLYQEIIVDKKMKNENTIFLEDMLNKLIEKETYVQQKINERKQNIFSMNSNEKYTTDKIKNYNMFNLDFSKINKGNFNNSLNTNIHILSIKNPKLFTENNNKNNNSSSILITSQNNNLILNTKNTILNNNPKKLMLKSELTQEKIQSALTEIFLFYSALISENDNIEGNDINNKYIDLNNYFKFCYDYKILLTKPKIQEIFIKYSNRTDDNNFLFVMNFENFKSSLMELAYEMNSIKKQKLLKIISEKKSIINYMELKECQRQEEEKNHNKFTEKITGGTAKKAMEKNQYEYISKHKKISEDIIKSELEYEKECKKSDKEILDKFYRYLGIDSYNYKNKMKNTKTNLFYGESLNNNKNNNRIIGELKSIDTQGNKIETIRESKFNKFHSQFLSDQSINKKNYEALQMTHIKKFNNLQNNNNDINENNLLKTSSISKQNINKMLENSNKINWNQMQNIYFDYNPIYENDSLNKYKNETDSDQELIEKLTRTKKHLIKNHSALDLKGINKNNILPPIKINNQYTNENNLRYYYNNNISSQKISVLTNQNEKISYNSEEFSKLNENKEVKNLINISSIKEE